MINVEVRKENHVELGHLRATLPEAKGAATTGIDEHTRTTILPDEITAGGAFVLQFGSAGAEDLGYNTVGATGLPGR